MQTSSTPRVERRARLFELADSQAGYFTAAQAIELGYSYQSQRHHRLAGSWLEAGHGLFRLREYPATDEEELARLALWSLDRTRAPQAVVSHETALRLHALSDVLPDRIHLSVPPGFRKPAPPGLVLHHATLGSPDTEARPGFRVTTPERTLLDVSASDLSPEHLEAATRQALERGLVRRRRLLNALEGLDTVARQRLAAALDAA